MTQTLEDSLSTFIGRQGARQGSPEPVNVAMVRQWCDALGDHHPAYLSENPAIPPAMLQTWTMPRFGQPVTSEDAVVELYELLDSHGFTGIVATNTEQSYLRPLRLGEHLSTAKTIESIVGPKKTKLGEGYFITTRAEVVEQGDQTVVAHQVHRVLKFRPLDERTPATTAPKKLPIQPQVTLDTVGFFDAARRHQLVVQTCRACGHSQHPPWPGCQNCHSFDVEFVPVNGRGELFSFTTVFSPPHVSYDLPYVVGLVALEGGMRLVARIVGVDPDEVGIGMQLEVDFEDLGDGVVLPVFRPRRVSRTELGSVRSGQSLPELKIPITPTLVVATALASRDFQPVHHDPEYARAHGSSDIFSNIMSTIGFVGRYVTDWSGEGVCIKSISLRLGAQNHPGDTLALRGTVTVVEELETETLVTIEVSGRNSLGEHVLATVQAGLTEVSA